VGANSALRKVLKALLYPVANDATYAWIQACSKAWDIKRGTWREPELELVPLALKSGETALDLGANFGIFSLAMGKAAGATGRVICFEPVPFTFQALRRVGKLLRFPRSVELLELGCSDTNATIEFEVPVQTSGALSAGQAYIRGRNDSRPGSEGQVRWEETRTVRAEVVRLDDRLEGIEKLSLIKADIEGAEYFAFRGAENLINSFLPTVICEINPWFLDGFNVSLDELIDFFSSKGYSIYFFEDGSGERRLRPVTRDEIVEDNYVFIHTSNLDRFASLL